MHQRGIPGPEMGDVCRVVLSRQSMAVSIHDASFRLVYANPAYARLFGLAPGDRAEGEAAGHFDPRAVKLFEEVVLPALREGGRWSGDLEFVGPDGESRHVTMEFEALRDENGPGRFFGTYFDATSRKSLEKSLHLQVDFLNNILDAVPDPIFVKEEHHNWIVANAAYCDFIGLPRELVIGRNDRDYFPKDEADVFWRTDDAVFASGEENINEEPFTDKNGVTHMISTKKACFTQDDGQRVLVGVFRDMTEDRRALKVLANSYRQLEEAFVDLQARLRGVQSHITSEVTRTEAIKDIISRSTEEFQVFAQRLGHGLSLSQAPPPDSNRPRMSRREHQVFILLAQGRKVKEVAESLSLSPNTVSTYRARIMKKLKVATTAELIQYALRSGLA